MIYGGAIKTGNRPLYTPAILSFFPFILEVSMYPRRPRDPRKAHRNDDVPSCIVITRQRSRPGQKARNENSLIPSKKRKKITISGAGRHMSKAFPSGSDYKKALAASNSLATEYKKSPFHKLTAGKTKRVRNFLLCYLGGKIEC